MKRANENGGKEKDTVLCDFSHGRARDREWMDAFTGFLEALEAKKRSPDTIKKRDDDLRKLGVYLESRNLGLGQVTLPDLEAFRLALIRHGYSESVTFSAIQAARMFFAHLEEGGHIFENPARKIKNPKPKMKMGVVLSEAQVHRLLSAPDLARPEGLRDRAIMEVLYSTGMRRGELVALTLFDPDLDRDAVRITGKGRKERVVPLGREAVRFLRLYIREARPAFLPTFRPAPEALWLNRRQKALGSGQVVTLLKKHGESVGLDVDAHTLRRSCATHLLRGGAHPVAVAELLGHTGIKTLGHYLQTTPPDLMAAHAKSKPGR
ncbi:MAG: tyrosine-type recombinase/integrase [Verrucomicrobia bacterium]|nr:tyrosine-type recombinase/integrase [Verrucomicrobiota bacterium]